MFQEIPGPEVQEVIAQNTSRTHSVLAYCNKLPNLEREVSGFVTHGFT